MQAVAVGGFHHDIIRRIRKGRILEQGLVLISDISGEHDLFFRTALREPDLHAGGTKQVSDVGEAEADTVAECIDISIRIGSDQPDQIQCVLHGIDCFIWLLAAAAFFLFVPPLSLHCLDMGGVSQHDIAQTCSSFCRDDLPAEPVLIEFGQHTCMINVGMCHDHEIDFGCRDRERHILVLHSALPHTTVNQNIFVSNLYVMTAPGHFVSRSDKLQFHALPPFA